MNPLQAVKNCRHFSSQIFCVIAVAVSLTILCRRIPADEERPGIGSNRSESLPHGARQSGNVGRNPSPSLQGTSNERLIQAHSRMEAERAAQTQRIDAAYKQLQKARSQGGGGYDSPEQSKLIEEYNRAIRIRDARSAVSQELRSRQITPDGKWNMPHPTRNPPPGDVFRSRGSQSAGSANASASGSAARGSQSSGNSVALPGANAARGRSDTIAEGRASGNSSSGSSSTSSPRASTGDATAENGMKPAARGDATIDTRNAQASQSESARASRGPGVTDVESAPRNNSGEGGRAAQMESESAARTGRSTSSGGGTHGRASSPAPVTGGTIWRTTRDAQGSVGILTPLIIGSVDVGARILNRQQDVAEGREISSTGEFAAETAAGFGVGMVAGTVVGAVGTAGGALIGGAIGFVAGGPAGATLGAVQGAQLGGGMTVGAMTAIGAIRSGESLGNALDRAFFNGDDPIQNQDELLRTGLGDVPQTNQVAAGPLAGPAQGELAPAVQSPELAQVQSQLLSQFPELANASPEEQREIALQVLGLSGRERDEVMTPNTSDAVEGPPVSEEIPLHPPVEIGGTDGTENEAGEGMEGRVATDGDEDLDSLLDSITGPRENFDGTALEDFLDQMGADPANVNPETVIAGLEREFDDYEDQTLRDLLGDFGTGGETTEGEAVLPAGAGDESDFADTSVSSLIPYTPPNVGGDIDLSIFRSAQEREDMRNLFRTDGDYDEAMRLEGDLQRAEAAYRRAIAEARRMAAARRAAEAAERQRQAQIAYNNWVRQHQAWQRWMAQQQAYRNWVAQQQNVSHYSVPQRSAGHQSGGLIMDPAQ